MSEYLHIEKPVLDQLAAVGWQVLDRHHAVVPTNPLKSPRTTFDWFLPEVFRAAVRAINLTPDGRPWLMCCHIEHAGGLFAGASG